MSKKLNCTFVQNSIQSNITQNHTRYSLMEIICDVNEHDINWKNSPDEGDFVILEYSKSTNDIEQCFGYVDKRKMKINNNLNSKDCEY